MSKQKQKIARHPRRRQNDAIEPFPHRPRHAFCCSQRTSTAATKPLATQHPIAPEEPATPLATSPRRHRNTAAPGLHITVAIPFAILQQVSQGHAPIDKQARQSRKTNTLS